MRETYQREAHQGADREGGNPPCVRPAPIAMSAQTHRTNQFAFDRTEPTYYPRTMATPSKPQSKETSCNLQSTIYNPQSLPPAVCRNRHNATESDEPQRKLVRTRAGQPAFRFLFLGMDCSQVAADSTYRSELQSSSRHANKSNGTAPCVDLRGRAAHNTSCRSAAPRHRCMKTQ